MATKKVLWFGNVFNPTGIATANREIVKALVKLGYKVQCADIWNDRWEFNKGLEFLNTAINPGKEDITIFADYPQNWKEGVGRLFGYFLHEGTLLYPGWSDTMNKVEKMFIPSKATKNLFKWNGVVVPMDVIPYGTNPDLYKPLPFGTRTIEGNTDEYIFLSVNSWTGQIGDRKGTDILIKAFDEEFKEDEKVKLLLKIGTFWQKNSQEIYMESILNILGHTNKNIIFNEQYVPEEELVKHYQKSDCFVSPTRSEAFGLTILNAKACGLPVIVTKDINSGHMDFCNDDSTLFIDAPKMEQADLRFFAEGNMQPIPEKESLKKQMRYAFDNGKMLRKKAIHNSETIRKEWTWSESAIKLMEAIK
jgi:glycosyltransferase involved in cell wall biosynthesis